jgi:hypothetical protein
MPYISREARRELEWMFHPNISEHRQTRPASPGELNYCISRLIDNYIYDTATYGKLTYAGFNEVLGVLTAIQFEMYRRLIGPYEKMCHGMNGEVFCHSDTMAITDERGIAREP